MSTDSRLVACDVGSNATRLAVARVMGEARAVLQREAYFRVPLRLGADAFREGRISREKSDQLVESFLAFRHLLRVFQPHQVRAYATAALREADNGSELAERVAQESGIELEIISGAEEARVLLANAADPSLPTGTIRLYADVGGGSSELSVLAGNQLVKSASFRIGAVRLLVDRVEAMEWLRLRSWLSELKASLGPTEVVGSGGNLSKLYDLAGKDGILHLHALDELLATLESHSLEERVHRFALKPDRADVIVTAGRIYRQILVWTSRESLRVPKLGLLDGMLSLMHEELLREPPIRGHSEFPPDTAT